MHSDLLGLSFTADDFLLTFAIMSGVMLILFILLIVNIVKTGRLRKKCGIIGRYSGETNSASGRAFNLRGRKQREHSEDFRQPEIYVPEGWDGKI